MARFVILKHVAGGVHYDLMFERGGALKTFRAEAEADGDEIALEESFDHPLKFLDFEGVLPRAPGRVERWDAGTFEAAQWTEKKITVHCKGRRWNGAYIMERQNGKRWLARRQPK
jgi:hypothetical protein